MAGLQQSSMEASATVHHAPRQRYDGETPAHKAGFASTAQPPRTSSPAPSAAKRETTPYEPAPSAAEHWTTAYKPASSAAKRGTTAYEPATSAAKRGTTPYEPAPSTAKRRRTAYEPATSKETHWTTAYRSAPSAAKRGTTAPEFAPSFSNPASNAFEPASAPSRPIPPKPAMPTYRPAFVPPKPAAAPRPAEAPKPDLSRVAPGAIVVHRAFGAGTVLSIEKSRAAVPMCTCSSAKQKKPSATRGRSTMGF